MNRTKRLRAITRNGVALAVALVTLFPIFWMISTAFKPATEIYSLTPHPLPANPTWSNFANVINGSVIGMPYWTFLRNSLVVTLSSVVVSSAVALLAAWGAPSIVVCWIELSSESAFQGSGPVPESTNW